MKRVETVFDVREEQVPDTERPHIGVEIEFCSLLNHWRIAEHILKMRWAPHVTLQYDGSVQGRWNPRTRSRAYGHELAILLPAAGFEPILRQIVAWLVSIGAYVNSTCGLHVHLDCRHRDDERLFKRLQAAEKLLYRLVARRRAKGRYCRPLRGLRPFADAHGYHGIEPGAGIETVEVRMHEGTLDVERIINWIKLLQQLAKGRRLKAPTANGLMNEAQLTPEVRRYVRDNMNRGARL